MSQAVGDGVGEGWVADGLVPLVDRQLACDDRGAAALPIFEDFQEIAAFGGGWDGQASVARDQDQELGARDGFQNAAAPTVASGDGQGLEEPGNAVIHDPVVVAAGLVAECAGNPAFAQPCWPCDPQILVPVDPAAVNEVRHDRFVDAARAAHVIRRAFDPPDQMLIRLILRRMRLAEAPRASAVSPASWRRARSPLGPRADPVVLRS